jgi:hypothetical protein
MSTLQDITNNPEALADFNSMPRNERVKVINQIDPGFKEMKLKDRFEVLDHIEGVAPKPQGVMQEVGHAFNPLRTVPKTMEAIRGGLAGTGVGVEKAITTPGSFSERVQQALLSASPAIKPGYKPQPGEKLGYYAGKYSPELLGIGKAGAEVAAKGIETLGAPTVKEAYESLDSVLAKKGVEPGMSQITENTPKAIAEYASNTKKALTQTLNKGREFLADAETESSINHPSKLERIREDVTRIFNNKWESPKTQVGKDLSKIKDTATKRLIDQVPEIGDALKTVKSAYDKEKLIDAITKASKVLGSAAIAGVGLKSGMNLAQKVVGSFSGTE